MILYASETGISIWEFMLQSQLMLFVDCTMTNIQIIRPTKIVSSVPNGEIWRGWKFVGCAYEIWNFGVFRLGFNPKNICEPKLWISWQKTKYHRTCKLLILLFAKLLKSLFLDFFDSHWSHLNFKNSWD